MGQILVIDDEMHLREMTRIMLKREGHEVQSAEDGPTALEVMKKFQPQTFDIVLTDLNMPHMTGIEVLKRVRAIDPSTQVILMTAYASISTAVEAMKLGAYDYIEKPFKRNAFLALIQKALEKRNLLRENFILKQTLAQGHSFESMVGQSPAMKKLYDMIQRVAPTKTTILITGESGTGKELVAKAIHNRSKRPGPFVPVNCGAIPENLMESEFFGYVKGAFTGAQRDKVGYFQSAHRGTLFLDEIGEIPISLQVKLLRAIQEKSVQPVGSVQAQSIDVRIIAATNRDLRKEVEAKRFREDLFYRLNVIPLHVPPLRERPEDIPLLIQHFFEHYAQEHGKILNGIHPDAMSALLNYHYPGNVRELENIMERAVTLEIGEMISTDVLPYFMLQKENLLHLAGDLELPDEGFDLEKIISEIERSMLIKALKKTQGNRTEAAKLLHISFRSLRYRLDKYDIHPEQFSSRRTS